MASITGSKQSSVATTILEEVDIEEEFIVESDEDLLHKNTESFKCLTQIEISRSSLLRDPLYHFPKLEDPHLEEALWGTEAPVTYDNIGVERYKDFCKAEAIIPFKRVIKSLPKTTLDLKFYGLNEKEMRAICKTLEHNVCIKELSLQENWLQPNLVKDLADVLIHNQTISVVDLKLCEIGPLGIKALMHAIQANKTLVELDLSYNGLGNEGIMHLANGLKLNTSIRILNLSHNDLGDDALIELRPVVEDNYMIRELDLSWNYFFSPLGMKHLMEGLMENIGIFKLNLSWNGIGEKETVREIMLYLKSENSRLRHLDLSNNRITGIALKMLYAGLKPNEYLENLNIGYNPLTADEVEFFANAFFEPKDICNLQTLDFGNAWVNKSFIRLRNRIRRKDCKVIYGGIFSNYKIKGPVVKEVLLNRAKFVAMKQKQKKKRKDIGEFIVQLKDDPMPKDEFEALIKKGKIKLDADLMKMLSKTFEDKQKKIDVVNLKEVYLKMYPDTKPPVKEKKKKKGGRKKKK